MDHDVLAKTANCSVLGMMNEFAFPADAWRDRRQARPDLLGLSFRLAGTQCSPLYPRQVSPDRELAARLREATGAAGG